jgi:hypothetical protein
MFAPFSARLAAGLFALALTLALSAGPALAHSSSSTRLATSPSPSVRGETVMLTAGVQRMFKPGTLWTDWTDQMVDT